MEAIRNFFIFDNWIYWNRQFVNPEANNDLSESGRIFNASLAMVLSREQEVIKREIDILEIEYNDRMVLQPRERLYLRALGYYKIRDYAMSQRLLEQCLEIDPEWERALNLKRVVDERVVFHGLIGMSIAVAGLGLFAGGLATMLSNIGIKDYSSFRAFFRK